MFDSIHPIELLLLLAPIGAAFDGKLYQTDLNYYLRRTYRLILPMFVVVWYVWGLRFGPAFPFIFKFIFLLRLLKCELFLRLVVLVCHRTIGPCHTFLLEIDGFVSKFGWLLNLEPCHKIYNRHK